GVIALEKLTLSTAGFIQSTSNLIHSTKNFIEESRSNFKNQESAIRNMETQVGQLARQLSTRSPNTFPSDTVVKPKEKCKAVVLRSGKVLEDNSEKQVDEQAEEKNVEGSPVMSTTEGSVQAKPQSTSLPPLVKDKEKKVSFP
ncbi:hypothetical protein PIB30_101736, partial [Stylosanthes scabra]|nr:hypothetical protein [Stylosanthes scabra]